MSVRHFLKLSDLSDSELDGIVDRAMVLRTMTRTSAPRSGTDLDLRGRTLALVFEKSSTRTRVSFECAMAQLGGSSIFMSPRDTQLGRGEPVEDTARVVSSMVDAVAVRTFEHPRIECFAAHSRVPVINALTDLHHPCQLLADMQTFREHRGAIRGARVAWIGDGNNMCNSYIEAAERFGFELRIACPEGYAPDASVLDGCAGRVALLGDPREAVDGAALVVTDVWASMGQEGEQAERARSFEPYRVDEALMGIAPPDALVMHCLPAHRGEEITAGVLDGPQSVVWDEAENRLHSQKALLEFLLDV